MQGTQVQVPFGDNYGWQYLIGETGLFSRAIRGTLIYFSTISIYKVGYWHLMMEIRKVKICFYTTGCGGSLHPL